MPKLIPIPADFADNAARMSARALSIHYRMQWRTVRRWCDELGIEPSRRRYDVQKLPVPDDFTTVAPVSTIADLCARYGVTDKPITRWEKETGVRAIRVRHRRTEKPAAASPVRQAPGRPPLTPRQVALPAGREEEAAHYLRRFSPVYRCGPRGGADPQGKLWRCGSAILTPDELEARARRHGWDPDEWRVIAGQSIRRDALPSFPKPQTQGARHG